ncbi:MAG: restriction endonuclease [Calditrichia bacterium]
MENWFYYLIAGTIIYQIGKYSTSSQIRDLGKKKEAAMDGLRKAVVRIEYYRGLFESALTDLKKDSVLLPRLAHWAEAVQKHHDEVLADLLETKKRPAYKAADVVREVKSEARLRKKELDVALNRVSLYESLAPWLIEYTDIPLDEMLDSLRYDKRQEEMHASSEDPVSLYVPKSEWQLMSVAERDQLALDRYCNPSRKKSPWAAGIEYERYIGYLFEKKGYQVNYFGATKGKEDLGIDLVCSSPIQILIIQCKRLSAEKGIPVRENVIAQIYGSAMYYKMTHKVTAAIKPVLFTTYELSEEARKFAIFLGVQVREHTEIKPYPMIKCNISKRTGEKIYHLPFDQQYDKVIIGDVDGEFYANNINEAQRAGFRRAFRWKGAAV